MLPTIRSGSRNDPAGWVADNINIVRHGYQSSKVRPEDDEERRTPPSMARAMAEQSWEIKMLTRIRCCGDRKRA